MTKNASIITITPTNNTSANNQELVLYRDSDLPFPDPKDDDEYEESFQRSRRIRILVIMAAALLVVGAAIAITFAAIPTSDASQSSGPYESLDLNALDYGPGKNIMIRATANNDAT
ncbi:hypothetical protein DYB34_013190, partial [Aphanomyces astaci]